MAALILLSHPMFGAVPCCIITNLGILFATALPFTHHSRSDCFLYKYWNIVSDDMKEYCSFLDHDPCETSWIICRYWGPAGVLFNGHLGPATPAVHSIWSSMKAFLKFHGVGVHSETKLVLIDCRNLDIKVESVDVMLKSMFWTMCMLNPVQDNAIFYAYAVLSQQTSSTASDRVCCRKKAPLPRLAQ